MHAHAELRALVAQRFADRLERFDRYRPSSTNAWWDADPEGDWVVFLLPPMRGAVHYVHLTRESTTWRVIPMRAIQGLTWADEPEAASLTLAVAPPIGPTQLRATAEPDRRRLAALYEELLRVL